MFIYSESKLMVFFGHFVPVKARNFLSIKNNFYFLCLLVTSQAILFSPPPFLWHLKTSGYWSSNGGISGYFEYKSVGESHCWKYWRLHLPSWRFFLCCCLVCSFPALFLYIDRKAKMADVLARSTSIVKKKN